MPGTPPPPPKDTPVPLYEEVELRDPRELLDALTPHTQDRRLWDRGDEGDWIFRGQAEAAWRLVPSAQRPNAFLHFIPGQIARTFTPEERLTHEAQRVLEFGSLVAQKGLEAPGDSQELRHATELPLDVAGFPPVKLRGMFGLAQHYGIPTRLLDWTWKPLVAAYFAAIEPACRIVEQRAPPAESDERLAVWALQRGFLDRFCRGLDPGAVPVTVPTTSNPNLALQAGLFTLAYFHGAPAPGQDIPPLDELFQDPRNISLARMLTGAGLPPLPMLWKFTLPHAEARHLLHYLHLSGVSAATVYSGHKAAAEDLLEARYRARPEHKRQ